MYNKRIILIGGIPAAGKTTFAAYLSEKLQIPMICKDHIKECLYDVLQYDTSTREIAVKHGIAGYSVFFHVAAAPTMDFSLGPPVIKIDATDFGRVSYDDITEAVLAFLV